MPPAEPAPSPVSSSGLSGGPPVSVDCLVVGAGIAGLACAQRLHADGRSVVVVDKSRGVGGRAATRRDGDARFDHGAQYCTARDADFRTTIDALAADGRIRVWFDRLPQPPDVTPPSTDPCDRWIGVDGMSSLAKAIAAELPDVRTRRRVRHAAVVADGAGAARWRCTLDTESAPVAAVTSADDAAGTLVTVDAACVVWTPPVPQTLTILDLCGVRLPDDVDDALRAVRYLPCCTLMVRPGGPVGLGDPGAFAPMRGPVAWIADNRRKGVSPSPSVTIQATGEWSAAHIDDDDASIVGALLDACGDWLPDTPESTVLHRWRYATPDGDLPSDVITSASPAPTVFCGDAFGGGRVEGAAVSGHRAAHAVAALLDGPVGRG